MAGSDAADRSASPVAVRQRLLHASRNNATVWYFEVHLGGSSLEQAAQQLPPGRPHLRAARQLLCQRLNVAGASLAWPRPGLLGVHLLVPEDSTEAPAGSTWSHWLVRSHLRGDLADAAKALLRTAPKGFDTLEVENVTAPSPVKDFWVDASEEVLDLGLELTGASLQEASISKSVTNGFVWNHGLQARDLLVWIDGRPSTEMSPEELAAELRSVRPLRLGFVRPGASVVQSPIVRSPGSISDVNEQVDQEIQELRGRRKHLQQLQQKLLEAQAQQLKSRALPGGTAGVGAANPAAGSAGATAEAVTGPGAMLRSGALPGGTAGVGAADPAAGSAGATAEAVTGPGAELLEEAAEAAAARAREEAAAELWNLRSEEQLVVKEAEEAAAQARLEASVAPALAWARAEEEVLQELERLQLEQRREESVAEAVREQAERLHLEESLVVRKQEEADHAREEAKKDGAKARHEAREALDAELEQLRLERGEALLASEEAKEALEMAEAKEKVTTECEEAAAKEVKNWEVLEQREKEMLQVAEVRERELEAEAVVKYEQREKELLFPALATARAEREEAAAARSHARDYAMQEVASELEKLRHGQSEAQVARSEAQLARAEVIKQEGEIRRMEDEAAQEVLKWENAVAIKERDALSRYAEKEQQLLGESKAEQQVAASLRLRELALRTGEEDLMATLRKRDHAILKQEKKVEEMEMSAEAMAERARDRAEDLAESLQERAKALALTAEARETKLQQREEELNSMVADQLRAMEDLQKLRSEFHAAETAAVIFEADQLQKEMGSRVLLLDAKSRDAQLGFVVGGFDTGRGLLVSKVLHGSWAEQKGLKEGDELTSLDGKDVKDLKEPEILEALQSQRPLKLGFLKPDPKLPAAAWPATAVPPASAIAAAAPAAPAEPGAEQEFWPASEKQAESLELLADESVEQLGLDLTGVPPSAVRIKQVLPDSWADAQAVHAGDELVKVNGQLTSSLSQQQIGLALRQTRPLRLTLARPTAALSGGRPSGARGSQGRPRESGKVLTFEAKEADERLGFKAGGKPPGEVCVDKLFPNLWAEKQGLRLKDVLEELNGQRLSEMQPEHLDQLIKTRPLTLVFRRRDGVGNDVATGSSAASGGLAAAGARLATAQKAVKPKAKAEPMAPSGPLKESVDLELPVGEKQLGFVPWGLPPARVMVRQVTGARAQKALLQVGHELVEVNEVHVRDIPRVELERTLLTRPLKLHFVASEASQGAFAVPAARDAEIEDEEVQAGILDLVATPDHDHLGFETTSSLNFNAVEVAKVEPGSWAMRMRIRMGDHLLSQRHSVGDV